MILQTLKDLMKYGLFQDNFYIHLLFYQRFKICVNDRRCFIKFLVMIKLFFKTRLQKLLKHYKNLYFHILPDVFEVCFLFLSKEDNLGKKNHHYFFILFLLIMLIVFFLQYNAPSFSI